VALRVTIEPIEKTLTSEEIENLSSKIIAAVTSSNQAILRTIS
jgi:phenylalanyl-tRNA synthetase beta subunit